VIVRCERGGGTATAIGLVVSDLMKLGLSVRTISAGTDIPSTSVHRAMRAAARAEAKQEVAVLEIMDTLLEKQCAARPKGAVGVPRKQSARAPVILMRLLREEGAM
jgi:hypothetical protein